MKFRQNSWGCNVISSWCLHFFWFFWVIVSQLSLNFITLLDNYITKQKCDNWKLWYFCYFQKRGLKKFRAWYVFRCWLLDHPRTRHWRSRSFRASECHCRTQQVVEEAAYKKAPMNFLCINFYFESNFTFFLFFSQQTNKMFSKTSFLKDPTFSTLNVTPVLTKNLNSRTAKDSQGLVRTCQVLDQSLHVPLLDLQVLDQSLPVLGNPGDTLTRTGTRKSPKPIQGL